MKIFRFLIGMSCLSFALQLQAQEPERGLGNTGWYIGGTLDYIDFDGKYTEADLPLVGNSRTFDSRSGGISLYGGFDINDFFGVEVVIRSDGDVSDSKYYDASFSEIAVTPKLAWQLHKKFGLYARAGIAVGSYYMELDRTVPGADDEFLWSGIGLTGGVGAHIAITDQVQLRLAYDYSDLAFESVEDSAYNGSQFYWVPDIDATVRRASVGVLYRL